MPEEIHGLKFCVICGTSYTNGRALTCSQKCHDKLVSTLIAKFGEFKKVVCARTGVAYKVPTRDILEKGLREEGLNQYPIWEDKTDVRP